LTVFHVTDELTLNHVTCWFSEGTEGRRLTWGQRISTTIGLAKGIQFLHGGIIPGLFANNLKITNILLDQNQVAKIGSYNIPILSETMKSEVHINSANYKHNKRISLNFELFQFGLTIIFWPPSFVDECRGELEASIHLIGTCLTTTKLFIHLISIVYLMQLGLR
jgi:hypothetical protein